MISCIIFFNFRTKFFLLKFSMPVIFILSFILFYIFMIIILKFYSVKSKVPVIHIIISTIFAWSKIKFSYLFKCLVVSYWRLVIVDFILCWSKDQRSLNCSNIHIRIRFGLGGPISDFLSGVWCILQSSYMVLIPKPRP